MNLISGDLGDGVDITGASTADNLVEGNYIGPAITGVAALGNALEGVSISDGSTANTIGGTTAGAGNVISGNAGDGLVLFGTGNSDNLVAGNDVGVTADGGAELANTYQGVAIFDGATGNTIGGTTAGARNTITGNGTASTSQYSYANLAIYDSGTSNNLIEGNYIGSDSDNTAGLNAPYTFGAFIGYGATYNTIGGTSSGSSNIISGNTSDGVEIYRGWHVREPSRRKLHRHRRHGDGGDCQFPQWCRHRGWSRQQHNRWNFAGSRKPDCV